MRNLSVLLMLVVLVSCSTGETGGSGQTNVTTAALPPLPDYMRAGHETYHEGGGVGRPDNAIDVFILYSPESQEYMPRIIEAFNRRSAAGQDPRTGQPRPTGERPIFVRGQQPTTGSSGTAAQGIINAIIAPQNANVYHPTIFQPSVSHWLALVNEGSGRTLFNLAEAQPTALTPVVVGIWESRHRALQNALGREEIGWDDLLAVLNSPNGWADYGIDTGRRAVYYGHADPNISSTGLSATISQYYACARQNGFNERRMTLTAVNDSAVQGCVRGVEQLIRHYSSRTEDFLEYIARGSDYLDMLALEETDLICLNRGATQGDQVCNKPEERLIAIYPSEGTFWHEHPFGIVNASWVTAEQRQAAVVFTEFVLSPEMQQLIMAEGYRPANPAVPLGDPLLPEYGIDPSLPSAVLDVPDARVIQTIQQNWRVVKKQAEIMLVVDVSGSMNNENRIGQAKESLVTFLQNTDTNNRVGLLTFSDMVTVWDPLAPLEQNRDSLLLHITCQNPGGYTPPVNALRGRCLQASGSTSLYTAIRTAIDILDTVGSPDRIRAVIVLSDGQDTCAGDGCSSLQDVISKIERTRAAANPVLVIPIAYGSDADTAVLASIARASATRLQVGDPGTITDLLRALASYF